MAKPITQRKTLIYAHTANEIQVGRGSYRDLFRYVGPVRTSLVYCTWSPGFCLLWWNEMVKTFYDLLLQTSETLWRWNNFNSERKKIGPRLNSSVVLYIMYTYSIFRDLRSLWNKKRSQKSKIIVFFFFLVHS